MARPSKIDKIDQTQFEKLCALQCNKGEIAGFFDVSDDSIDRYCKKVYGESFAVVLDKKSSHGKIGLRRAQFKLAEKNAAMAIFLGKNYLGQKDVVENTNNEALDKLDDILASVRSNAAAVVAQNESEGDGNESSVHSETE